MERGGRKGRGFASGREGGKGMKVVIGVMGSGRGRDAKLGRAGASGTVGRCNQSPPPCSNLLQQIRGLHAR